MSACGVQTELRLVVLGRSGSGGRSEACSILGLRDCDQRNDNDQVDECRRFRAEAAGRKLLVVSSPDWFSSDCEPEERRKHFSSLITLSIPGPHVFLLCVPLDQPADGETKVLDVLEKLLGPSAVNRNTIILFTNMEELEEDESLEDYLAMWRKDLGTLLERCGGRYHALETKRVQREESESVEELLEKIEQVVKDNNDEHFSCPLYEEVSEKVKKRQVEIVKERMEEDSVVTEKDMEEVLEEAEKSIGLLHVELDDVFSCSNISPSSPTASFLRTFWEKVVGWLNWLPTMVRREALLGALVGLFVGGPVGGMLGATVGSVATEVRRRQTQKTK